MTRVSEVIHGWLGWCPNASPVQQFPVTMPNATTPGSVAPSGAGRGRIRRGVHILKGSWKILISDKSLFWFSVLAGLVMLALFTIAFFGGIFPVTQPGITQKVPLWFGETAIAGSLFMAYILIGLFLSISAKLEGKPISVHESFSRAAGSFRSVLGWLVILAAGYTILVIILNVFINAAAVIAVAIVVSVILSLATQYVLPVLALERKDLVPAIKESLYLFKKTWAEIITGGGIIILIYFAVEVAAIALIVALYSLSPQLIWAGVATLFLALGVFVCIATMLSGIFLMGLYSYAKNSRIPEIFEKT